MSIYARVRGRAECVCKGASSELAKIEEVGGGDLSSSSDELVMADSKLVSTLSTWVVRVY